MTMLPISRSTSVLCQIDSTYSLHLSSTNGASPSSLVRLTLRVSSTGFVSGPSKEV